MDTKRLRQRVLDLAIHGKLVPQNPQDEPASELLKRIAAEKERLVKEGKIKKSKKKDNEDIDEVPFEVPQGWVWCRLEDITSQITDGEHKTPKRVKSYCGYYLLSARNVLNGSINLNDVDYVDKEEYDIISRRCNPVLGDILISCSGTVGRIAVIKDNNKYVMVRSAAVAKPLFVISDYLLYTLQSPELQMQIEERSKQTAQANLFQGEIRMLQIPLPPLAEQHRIVSEVEKYFSLIDILEESENDLQQSIQKAKSKILDLAIKGKLVEQDEEDEPASILLERIKEEKNQLIKEKKIKKEKALAEITEEEKFFEIPKNWIWCRWGDLSFSIQYGYNAPAQDSGEIRMVRISDIQNNEVLWDTVPFCNIKKDEIDGYLLQPNDILFARTGGTVGKSFLVDSVPYPSIYAGYLIRTRYSHDLVPNYLKYFMESHLYWEQLRDGTIATAQPNCNGKTLGNMILPLPPLAEQHRIVEKVETIFTQLDNIAEALK